MSNITQEILFSSNTQPENQELPQSENERLALLKQHFPNCFDKHGAFLPDKMAEILHSDGIATQKEGYSLNWLGKSYARVLKDTPPETLLAEDTAHNRQPENANSENLLIKGDNLEVLKHLKHTYKNQIKMIYIDPPYNTGSDGFVYQDDRKFTPEQLAQLGGMDLDEAKRVLEFTAKKSNSHSAWLTFMYPRLYMARELLREDGVIFISIDDNEQAQLKILCDEVFGEENFVGEIIIKTATDNNPRQINTEHEYMLCYAKKKNKLSYWKSENKKANLILAKYHELKNKFSENNEKIQIELRKWIKNNTKELEGVLHYDNVDNKGVFHDGDIANTTFGGYIYDVIHPITGKICKVPEKGFRYEESTLKKMISDGDILFGSDENTLIKPKKRIENAKDILRSVIYEDGRSSTKMFENLMARDIFQNPKSPMILERLFGFIVNKNDIVMDFFAGSGTTAETVMNLNIDNIKVKYILVQIDENIDTSLKLASQKSKKTLQNAIKFLDTIGKPHNIFEITKERIIRSAAKIRAENPDYSGDLGFKIFQIEPNFQAALNDDFDPAQAEIPDSKNAMLSNEQLHTLLTTWRVYDGATLPEKVQTIDLAGYTAYYCRNHLYLLASGFRSECVKALIEKLDNDKDFVPERIVLFSQNMESAMQKELAQAVKTYVNKKGLDNLSVLARV